MNLQSHIFCRFRCFGRFITCSCSMSAFHVSRSTRRAKRHHCTTPSNQKRGHMFAMGQPSSTLNVQKRTKQSHRLYRHNPRQDGPYVWAIGNPEHLDWKNYISSKSQENTKLKSSREERQARIIDIATKQTQMPVAITPTLFISNSQGVSNIDKLKELGITHVLNVGGAEAAWLPPQAYTDKGMHYKLIEAYDETTYPLLQNHWDECQEYLQQVCQTKNGICVVHCQAGMNRSGLIVAAWFMVTHRKNVLETVLHCRTCRGNWFLHSNPGFQTQLVALARHEGLLGPAPGEPNCLVAKMYVRSNPHS